LVEFSDFQCPYCKAFHSTIEEALGEYGDQIQFVFKQLPLESIHPMARTAALASECANEQGKFLDYAGRLFDFQDNWGKAANDRIFKTYAAQLGLNNEEFGSCLDEKEYEDKINADLEEAMSFGISGTPALFVNDQFISGVSTFEDLKSIIDEELAK